MRTLIIVNGKVVYIHCTAVFNTNKVYIILSSTNIILFFQAVQNIASPLKTSQRAVSSLEDDLAAARMSLDRHYSNMQQVKESVSSDTSVGVDAASAGFSKNVNLAQGNVASAENGSANKAQGLGLKGVYAQLRKFAEKVGDQELAALTYR
eukprot:SAG31_NODE_9265_length_1307_cov_0.632450_2_plen_151_part_00